MILFHTIRWSNFLACGKKPIELQLDANPTTLVYGFNGSGKSSLLDALSYVLYGKPFRTINKDGLINSINGKDCLVEIDFSIGSRKYQVRRGMKPYLFEIFQDGVMIPQPGGSKDYQEHLEKKILRMNHKSFCQIVILGSATFVPFMKLHSGARREIIEDLLDLQVFSQMNTLLKSRRDTNKQNLKDIKYELDLVEEKVKLQREYIENITSNNQEQIEESQKKIDKANIEIVKLNEKIVILTAEIVNLTATIEHHDKTQGKYETYLKFSGQLEDRLKKITKEMEFYSENQHCPTCRQGIEESFKCEIIETRTVTKTELEEAVSQLAGKIAAVQKELREIHEVQKEISEHQRKIGTHNSEINVLNRLIAEKSKEIDSLHKKFSEDRNEHSRLDALLEEQMIYNEKRESLVTEKATFDIAQVLLKDGGIKAKIIAQYIPVINSAINKYLTLLDLFVQFELDENFDEKIKSRYREEFSYDSFSEGEKMRLNLAVTFAWRAIAKMRNSSNTNLLIFDEISDGSLDQDGREGFIKIIKDIANQGTHVWVISHNEGMADKLSSSVKFEKVKNYSRIVEG